MNFFKSTWNKLDPFQKKWLRITWGLAGICVLYVIIEYYLTKEDHNYKPKQHKQMEIDSVTMTGANLCKWPKNDKL